LVLAYLMLMLMLTLTAALVRLMLMLTVVLARLMLMLLLLLTRGLTHSMTTIRLWAEKARGRFVKSAQDASN
jgi:hypothetical protein